MFHILFTISIKKSLVLKNYFVSNFDSKKENQYYVMIILTIIFPLWVLLIVFTILG